MLEILNTVLLSCVLTVQILFSVPAQDLKYLLVILAPIVGVGGVAIAHQFYPLYFEASLWGLGFLVFLCVCAWGWIETREGKRILREIRARKQKAKSDS